MREDSNASEVVVAGAGAGAGGAAERGFVGH